MPGSIPPTSQLDWLSSTTAMIVLLWSRATRDLLKSFGWGIVALHRLNTATKLPSLRRPPHRIFESRLQKTSSRHASQHHMDWRSLASGSGSDPGEGPEVRIHFPQQRVRRTSVSRGWRGGSFCSSRYDAQHRGGPSGCAV